MRILIAEDDPTSRQILAAMLKKWGYETILTSDGNEAWEALQAEDAPRFAILDWMMPGLEGPELCRRIRKQSSTTPSYILLLTARTEKEDIAAGLEAGADDYVTKPFDRNELHARVEVGRRMLDLQSILADRVAELELALDHVKTLKGIVPICCNCKNIRDDKGFWSQVEKYVSSRSEAEFSHGICPKCVRKLYPEVADVLQNDEGGE